MVHYQTSIKFEIILLLLKKDTHVRGIAQELNQSHSTILRKLNKLNKDNVVDFRIQGKNKVFFLKKNLISYNYVLQSEIYKSTKLTLQFPELGIIFEEILEKTDEKLIVLFGSYAKEIPKKHSDIDIFIRTNSRNVKKTVEEINSKIIVKVGDFDNRSLLIKEIIKNHVIIRGYEEFYEEVQFFESIEKRG